MYLIKYFTVTIRMLSNKLLYLIVFGAILAFVGKK